jgi:hypothetical protein
VLRFDEFSVRVAEIAAVEPAFDLPQRRQIRQHLGFAVTTNE